MEKSPFGSEKEGDERDDGEGDGEHSEWKARLRKNKDIVIRLPRRPENRKPITECPVFCLSFAGCGFLGTYEFGVAHAIATHGSALYSQTIRFAGTSSGSLVATLMLFNPTKASAAAEEIYKISDDVHASPMGVFSPGFMIGDKLRRIIEKYIPDDISPANNRLFISTWKNEIISTYSNREELINVLMASCYHPMYSTGIAGKAPVVRGESYIDGGYTNNLPEFSDVRSISISPFLGDADICPPDKSSMFTDVMMIVFNQNLKLNVENIKRLINTLLPPPRDVLEKYYEMGKQDATKFLKQWSMHNV
ncbi:unnamed protein product [Caenorhabditis bovis]|uniref:PNPLA domain-containing protein n=1 Tax=Caenorhabditis bovis TaxID=2654633 RepID=A0A8S1EEV6_9PELO|nr:unnamed protein product [Caenorhabditis bovis]